MKTVSSFSNRYVLVAVLLAAACFTPKASADLLTNTWFKLTFAAKGHTLDTNNVTVRRLNLTRTVYLNLSTNVSSPNNYRLRLWTKVDGVWSNSFNATKNVLGLNENFFSDLNLSFRSSSNATVFTYESGFFNNKTNASGRLRSSSYSGGGEVYGGNIDGKNYVGTFSLIGPKTSPSLLPFTP